MAKAISKTVAKQFREALLARRETLVGSLNHLEDEALKKTKSDAATMDISNFADLGSDNYEQELDLDLMENEKATVREIDEALKRLDEGTFGVCGICGKLIPKNRLKAKPYARLCVKCKEKQEQSEGGV